MNKGLKKLFLLLHTLSGLKVIHCSSSLLSSDSLIPLPLIFTLLRLASSSDFLTKNFIRGDVSDIHRLSGFSVH
ncbi:hypothetical protein RIF29_23071 [Crotalaria pallida]|uniref:Secreted protein n=1 Tax=Crotalaria pallida TaxID=3830 RepID=A0AAN9I795_CROPI